MVTSTSARGRASAMARSRASSSSPTAGRTSLVAPSRRAIEAIGIGKRRTILDDGYTKIQQARLPSDRLRHVATAGNDELWAVSDRFNQELMGIVG